MPWICKLVDIEELQKEGQSPQAGNMWYAPRMREEGDLSPEYERDWKGKRPPLCVQLPNGDVWCVDLKFSGKNYGWTVTGVPPQITTFPSVNSLGSNGYHGWLISGVLSDDIYGRSY